MWSKEYLIRPMDAATQFKFHLDEGKVIFIAVTGNGQEETIQERRKRLKVVF